ncbi:heptosyltransferase-2 [Roseateles sp. YR242]|uniref:glycosyltransferase family 9 protein n=1 Tax=Roseateles sp. YR242 TaxID=1855305 RepID=UPI0008D436C1|nr:glycosyltransferase family 9 protein [Roseateles sp. YR242]SEL43231.1 heptosyltransferase-2 [Roseateles sp. YR242]
MRNASDKPLVVRLRNFVGDVVLGVPALRLLQRHGHSLHLVGKPWASSLLEAEGWTVEPRPKRLGDRLTQLRRLRAQAAERDPSFDVRPNTVLFPWAFSAALDARLAGLKATGYANEARGWLLHRSLAMPAAGHALLNYWELACRFLGLDEAPPKEIGLKVSPAQQAAATALLSRCGVDLDRKFVLLCPFAGGTFEGQAKTWPQFKQFASLLSRAGHQVVVCPGPGEEAHAVEHYGDAHCLHGVSLGVYSALLQRAAIVVGNDTGPMHMAAAVGASVLSILGPTIPELWAPWGSSVEILRIHPAWPSPGDVLSRVEQKLD